MSVDQQYRLEPRKEVRPLIEEIGEEAYHALFQRVFRNVDGEMVLHEMRRLARYHESSFSTEPLEMARKEGVKESIRALEEIVYSRLTLKEETDHE